MARRSLEVCGEVEDCRHLDTVTSLAEPESPVPTYTVRVPKFKTSMSVVRHVCDASVRADRALYPRSPTMIKLIGDGGRWTGIALSIAAAMSLVLEDAHLGTKRLQIAFS